MIKRFDRLDVATADLADATAIYQRNFGFAVRRAPTAAAADTAADDAIVTVGDAVIRLRAGADAAAFVAANGEGLAAVWLEADDLDAVVAAFARARVPHRAVRREGDRRILEVDPAAANQVPLFIFDRRPA
jgi:hypothetical protein